MTSKKEKSNLNDLDILEELKTLIYKKIINDKQSPKVGDLLKIIEMKNKLTVSGKAEKKFWDMINQVREKELSRKKRTKSKK
jgi:hypothetical protein